MTTRGAPAAVVPLTHMDIVGPKEISHRLKVKQNTVHIWAQRDSANFPTPEIRVSGIPLWNWDVIQQWAEETGRL